MTSNLIKKKLNDLKKEYDVLKAGKENLVALIDESELPESVYNSNAIENSTLTLKETEALLREMKISRNVSSREIFEAKNLARIMEYIRNKVKETDLNKELILLIYQMLIGNIRDDIAGRFRRTGEYVRVATHIAPAPEKVESLIDEILVTYHSDYTTYFLDKIAKFHLAFESIHPFNDGNGRMGRTIINFQLSRIGFPFIIIRNKGKEVYYQAFQEYENQQSTKTMEKVIHLALLESFHKRVTYLKGDTIIPLSEYVKRQSGSPSALFNAAKRQHIPAFREKGIWKIGVD